MPFEEEAPKIWGYESCLTGEQLDLPCPASIDVTGYPRPLVRCAALDLDDGAWRVRAEFALCNDAARAPYALRAYGGSAHVEQRLRPQGPADYEIVTELWLPEPTQVTADLCLERAAFHGQVRFKRFIAERIT